MVVVMDALAHFLLVSPRLHFAPSEKVKEIYSSSKDRYPTRLFRELRNIFFQKHMKKIF